MEEKETTSSEKELTPKFTDRQLEIIFEWAENKSTALAAEKLNISEHTLHTHLKRMRRKLGVNRTFDVYLHLSRNEHWQDVKKE